MLIDKHIGFDQEDGIGILGDLFQKELMALDGMGKKSIQVWINSPGGIVTDGYNIFNSILKSQTPVDTYCTGMAASIAGVIFQAGRNRIMADYSFLMYHNPYGGDDDKGLDTIAESLAKMIATRSSMSLDKVIKMMNKTSYITAQEALESGLCDSIEDSGEANSKRAMKKQKDPKAFWKECNLIMNKLFQSPENKNSSQKFNTMSKVANKLGLVSEANEDSMVSAIDQILNKSKKEKDDADDKLDALKKDLEDKKKAMEKMKEEMDAVKEELDKMKAEKEEDAKKAKEKDEKDKEEKAKNMIADFVKAGRIANETDVIAKWEKLAKVDYDAIKDSIEKLPNSKTASKLPNIGTEIKPQSVINRTMADIRTKLAL